MNPLVSIITPTYNHEKFIGICIESVLKQTYQNWEMIIIDDDSTDRTTQIIKKYTDSRIRYVHQEHLGVYKLGITYNKALSMAQGEFVVILEGDDCLPPYSLEHHIPNFNEHQVVVTYGDIIGIDQYGKIYTKYQPSIAIPDKQIRENRPIGSALKEFLRPNNFIRPPTLCIRKEALLRIGGFISSPYLPGLDSLTLCHLAFEGEFRYLPEPLGYWRRHPQNTTVVEFFTWGMAGYRYCQDFLTRYQERIKDLPVKFDIENLKKEWKQSADKFNLSKEYWKATRHLELWEPQLARRYFLQYLKRRQKFLHLSLMSLIGIFSAYAGMNLLRRVGFIAKGIKRVWKSKK